jgi:hypothetical protein
VLADQASASIVASCGRNAVWLGEPQLLQRLPFGADVLLIGEAANRAQLKLRLAELGCDLWLAQLPLGSDTFFGLAAQRIGATPAED